MAFLDDLIKWDSSGSDPIDFTKTPTLTAGVFKAIQLIIFAPFDLLHLQHNVCRFSSKVMPPFDIGIMWSISNNMFFSSDVDIWQN